MKTIISSASKAQRQTNIELLRILAMFLIVSFHLSYKSGFDFSTPSMDAFVVKIFWLLGELGVNLFMLVTGYFLIHSKGTKTSKIILLLAEILFYYLVTFIIASLVHGVALESKREFLLLFFPTIFSKYWYATAYVILYILSPWINAFINALKQIDFLKMIFTLLVLYSLIPTFFGFFIGNTEGLLFYTRLLWLFIIYLCGAYFKLYRVSFFSIIIKPFALFIGSFSFMTLAIPVIAANSNLFAHIGTTEWAYFWPPNSVPMFLASIGMFGTFLNLRLPTNPFVNRIASTTFGVYLFHDGPLQSILWGDIVNAPAYQTLSILPVYIIGSAALVYSAGVIVDLCRQQIESRTLEKFFQSNTWAKLSTSFKTKVDTAFKRIAEKGLDNDS